MKNEAQIRRKLRELENLHSSDYIDYIQVRAWKMALVWVLGKKLTST